MKNTMISNKEIEAMKKVVTAFDEFANVHLQEIPFDKVDEATQVENVHILLYMDCVQDLMKSIGAINSLLDIEEEEFVKRVTDEGKCSLEEAERRLMMKAMIDIING